MPGTPRIPTTVRTTLQNSLKAAEGEVADLDLAIADGEAVVAKARRDRTAAADAANKIRDMIAWNDAANSDEPAP